MLKLKRLARKAAQKILCVEKFKDTSVRGQFELELNNSFQMFPNMEENENGTNQTTSWSVHKNAFVKAVEVTIRGTKKERWISDDT